MGILEKKKADYERAVYLLEELLHAYEYRINSISNGEEYSKRKNIVSLISLIKHIEEDVKLSSSSYISNLESLRKNSRMFEIEVETLNKRITGRYRHYSFKDSSDFRYCIYPDGVGICRYVGYNDYYVDIPSYID